MLKIAFIGAGSAVFTKNLVLDILAYPELRECEISLMDIDAERLGQVKALVDKVTAVLNLTGVRVTATADRREALRAARYVITTFRQGGLEACELDVDVPARFGLSQCMGDIVGPGGVFRGLRSVPVLLGTCRDMEELCPDAWLLNYVNPMAILTRAVYDHSPVKVAGICHSVVGTTRQLAGYLGVPFDEITYHVAGLNHMAWFLKLERRGVDLYPELRRRLDDPAVVAKDPVRFEILRQFGAFVTESSYHFSEYVPYFRKDPQVIEQIKAPTKLGAQWVRNGWANQKRYVADLLAGKVSVTERHSGEYAADIIHSLETNTPWRANLNVRNDALITNLPPGACVEVPCLLDGAGVHPTVVGELPAHLAALDRMVVGTQELAAEAAVRCDREMVFRAIALDPLTAAVLTLPRIREMVDALFEAERQYLPAAYYA